MRPPTGHISAAVQTNREWLALTRALDKPEWLEDPRFKTPALRQRHINERLAHDPGSAAAPVRPRNGSTG